MSNEAVLKDLHDAEQNVLQAMEIAAQTCEALAKTCTDLDDASGVQSMSREYLRLLTEAHSKVMQHSGLMGAASSADGNNETQALKIKDYMLEISKIDGILEDS
ncbi:hypothetical protein EON65_52040 [archaeon]|nr:MAG: hypothetical protein EON65_52040 [archaeon]